MISMSARALVSQVKVEACVRPAAARSLWQRLVPHEIADRERPSGRIRGINVKCGVAAHLRQRTAWRRHHWAADQHRFERRQPKAFRGRGKSEARRAFVKRAQRAVADATGEDHIRRGTCANRDKVARARPRPRAQVSSQRAHRARTLLTRRVCSCVPGCWPAQPRKCLGAIPGAGRPRFQTRSV